MGVVDNLVTTANVLGSAVAIHSSLKYFGDKIPNSSNHYTHQPPYITIEAEKNVAKVNENIIFRGRTTIPGIVEIYSADKKELQVYPDKGRFYAILYFTVPGIYEIWAKIYNHESNSVYIEIEP